MSNHPNRSRGSNLPAVPYHLPRWLKDRARGKQPSKEQIRKLRYFAAPTKREMAELLHVSLRAYEEWEAGRSPMHANHWLAMRIACAHYADERARRAREIRDERDGIAVASE